MPAWPQQPVAMPATPFQVAAPAAQAPMAPPPAVYAPAPEPVVWRQPAAQTPVTLQPAPGETAEAPPVVDFVPQHLQPSSASRYAIVAVVLCVIAGSAWVWMDLRRADAVAASASKNSATAASTAALVEIEPEVRKAAIASTTETGAAMQPPPDVNAITKDVRRLIDELFAADTAERRVACVHDGAKHREQIEALFGAEEAGRPRLRSLGSVKGLAQMLPGGQLLPLYSVITSQCAHGALLRLIDGPDGVRRIDWPLFFETHQHTLASAMKEKPEEPAWAWARIMPSHGFEIPATDRHRFIAFDMYVTADGKTPITACVERDTPLGRFLDRETDWRQSYLVRLLVRRIDMGQSGPMVTIADCEGTPAIDARPRQP